MDAMDAPPQQMEAQDDNQEENLGQTEMSGPEEGVNTEPNETTGSEPSPTESSAQTETTTTAVEPLIQTGDENLMLEEVGGLGRPLKTQTFILSTGKHLSEAITAGIVGPIVLFNSKVAAAAGALPPMLAAKGAIIGAAIATPIEVGAVAGSSIASGVTGKLVAIPISVAAGAAAKFVDAAEEGQHIWDFNVLHSGEILKNGLIKLGHIIFKPIFVIGGAKTALTGNHLSLLY